MDLEIISDIVIYKDAFDQQLAALSQNSPDSMMTSMESMSNMHFASQGHKKRAAAAAT